MKAMGESGLRTINEMRRLDNYPPLEGGDVYRKHNIYRLTNSIKSLTKVGGLIIYGGSMPDIRKTLNFDEAEQISWR